MDLEPEEHIASRPGRGTFAASVNVGVKDNARASIGAMADDVMRDARNLGIEDSGILTLMHAKLT